MRDEQKKIRHEVIKNAAYSLLAAKGYDGASMLSIAKAAKASNETLYRWYGDKRGLFEAMVRDNAEDIRTLLENAIEGADEPSETLRRVAPLLLTMLLGERAILLNRAAAADPSGELGAAIAAGGRDVIQPLIANLLRAVCGDQGADVRERADWFLGLLIGDLQIRRVIGVLKAPTKSETEARSQNALDVFFKLIEDQ
jgi:AcrR family transcriptional regulator